MSASESAATVPSQKRPLEDPSSPSGPTDQPDAKRPALDKIIKGDGEVEAPKEEAAAADGATTAASDGVKTDPVAESAAPVENGTKDVQGDTTVPDAPNAATASQAQVSDPAVPDASQDTHPIQTTTGNNERSSHTPSHSTHQDESSWIHIRAVITSAEAATVIGKGGENVTQIRRLSGAKCTVSDYSRGAVERILTVSGLVDAAAKVCLCTLLCASYANTASRLSD